MRPRDYFLYVLLLILAACSGDNTSGAHSDEHMDVDHGEFVADAAAAQPDASAMDSGESPGSDVGPRDAGDIDGMIPAQTKSFKRGIAYGFESANDLSALSQGVSWWYNWSPRYGDRVSDAYVDADMDWVPMTWNGNNPDEIRAFLANHPLQLKPMI